MKLLVTAFIFAIALICFVGYSSIIAFCRPYSEEEKELDIWSDDSKADYEHEKSIVRNRTGYFNLFVPTFYYYIIS